MRKKLKKIHPAESHLTYHLAIIGAKAIVEYLNKERKLEKAWKDYEAMDGDETEAVSKRLLSILDKNEGNK